MHKVLQSCLYVLFLFNFFNVYWLFYYLHNLHNVHHPLQVTPTLIVHSPKVFSNIYRERRRKINRESNIIKNKLLSKKQIPILCFNFWGKRNDNYNILSVICEILLLGAPIHMISLIISSSSSNQHTLTHLYIQH